ncbi:G8 domain-containing protein DDB_G0286311-like isoform X1 [Bubalus bubalis]|uniref:G8 domain-containing protein DDB_G0286311-like isoform X1 n=1 Tax=Bubalus bubalis TaxID=89462 RepID=UPI001E1B90CA|nr:G8 domain-containing protein DDB_G0286311-like isoform X1 [Bubalus bubalis]
MMPTAVFPTTDMTTPDLTTTKPLQMGAALAAMASTCFLTSSLPEEDMTVLTLEPSTEGPILPNQKVSSPGPLREAQRRFQETLPCSHPSSNSNNNNHYSNNSQHYHYSKNRTHHYYSKKSDHDYYTSKRNNEASTPTMTETNQTETTDSTTTITSTPVTATTIPKMTTTTTPVTTATTTSTITRSTTVPTTTKASTSALLMATPTEDFQPVPSSSPTQAAETKPTTPYETNKTCSPSYSCSTGKFVFFPESLGAFKF